MVPTLIVMSGSSPSSVNIASSFSCRCVPVSSEKAHGSINTTLSSCLHVPSPWFVSMGQAHRQEQTRLSRSAGASAYSFPAGVPAALAPVDPSGSQLLASAPLGMIPSGGSPVTRVFFQLHVGAYDPYTKPTQAANHAQAEETERKS